MLDKNEKKLFKLIKKYWEKKSEYPTYEYLKDKMDYQSKRSISILIDKLVVEGFLEKENRKYRLTKLRNNDYDERTRQVPLVGEVACGIPIFAQENIDAVFSISTKFAKPGNDYFLLKAIGKSMNQPKDESKEAINDRDLVLVEVTQTVINGEWIVALINDEATIKEYHFKEDHIILYPRSSESQHTPIILTEDFQIQGKVVKVFSGLNLDV